MFEVGDYILYGKNGVCELTGICSSPFDKKDTRAYYELHPVYSTSGVIYTPADNGVIASRKVMTKAEAEEFLKTVAGIELLDVSNEKTRRDTYKAAAADLSPKGFVSIIKTVRNRRILFEPLRKHITEADAEYESLAKKSLYSELSLVLGIQYDKVEDFLYSKIYE